MSFTSLLYWGLLYAAFRAGAFNAQRPGQLREALTLLGRRVWNCLQSQSA